MSKDVGKHPQYYWMDIGLGFGVALIALLLFAYYAYTWRSFADFKAAIDTCAEPFCDFASFYYPMGEAIFRTGLPVKGFMYSPFIAILLTVFPSRGLDASLALWGILQALFVILYLLLFRRLVPAGRPIQLVFVALVLSSFPLLHTLTWGQVSVFTTVAILGILVVIERDHRAAAAALFAFAVSFKFFPLIFLAPFVVRRDTRFLLFVAAACGAFLFVVPGVLLGVSDTLRFYGDLLESYRASDWIVSNYNSQHFPHVVLRLAEAAGRDAHDCLPLLSWISYGIAAANMGLVFLIQRAHLRYADLWSFHLIFLSIPFALKTSWPVDLVYMSFAQALLAWRLLDGEGTDVAWKHPYEDTWRKQTLKGRAAVTLFLVTSIVISNIVFFNLFGDRYHYGFYGFIFWADLLLLMASYIELLPPALRQIRMTSGGNVLSGALRPHEQAGGANMVSISKMVVRRPRPAADVVRCDVG